MKFSAFEAIDLRNNNEMLEISELFLSQIIPDENQPRKAFNEKTLGELALSIKEQGIIQPIIVKKIDNNRYQIIAGERRWRASHLAGMQKIKVIVHSDDGQASHVAISLIENIQREDLNPIELAEALYQLNHDHGFSHEVIADRVGKSRATITNLLRLLNLSPEVRDLLSGGKLEMGHAKALLTLSPEQQVSLANKIVEKELSVRDAEMMTKPYKFPRKKKQYPYVKMVDVWVEKLSKHFPSKVSVNINEKGEGKVIIHFTSPDEINWLVEQLNEKESPSKEGSKV